MKCVWNANSALLSGPIRWGRLSLPNGVKGQSPYKLLLVGPYYYPGKSCFGNKFATVAKYFSSIKRELFWQAGGDFMMWVTPAWCGWVDLIKKSISPSWVHFSFKICFIVLCLILKLITCKILSSWAYSINNAQYKQKETFTSVVLFLIFQ